MDWNKASIELAKPLRADAVRPPPRGKFGEYVDGLHVITEANRIFGHGGWSYEITRLQQVSGETFAVSGNPQFRCGWMCTVRVTIGGVSREGAAVGSGSGKPENTADVMESAVKEAETDALKRALRTFGNTFGLALYEKDKEKRQVEQPKPLPQRVDEAATADDINALIPEIKALNNAAASRHLHSRALSLGLVANKETGTYQPEQVAA